MNTPVKEAPRGTESYAIGAAELASLKSDVAALNVKIQALNSAHGTLTPHDKAALKVIAHDSGVLQALAHTIPDVPA